MNETKSTGWRIAMVVPHGVEQRFEAALEPFAPALTCFEVEEENPAAGWQVEAFTEEEPDRAALSAAVASAAAAAGVAEPALTVEPLPDVNWVAQNLADFPPLTIGRFHVYGSHVAEPVPPGKTGLLVDAATAFGSGRHASTTGELLAFQWLFRRRRFARALDMGCGSGILALALAKGWRVPTFAVDVDPESVRVTRENARLNGVASLVTARHSNGFRAAEVARRGPYDLIAANILARPLMAMAPELDAVLAPGGRAVLAGLLSDQARMVGGAYRRRGLILERELRIGRWSTLILAKPYRSPR